MSANPFAVLKEAINSTKANTVPAAGKKLTRKKNKNLRDDGLLVAFEKAKQAVHALGAADKAFAGKQDEHLWGNGLFVAFDIAREAVKSATVADKRFAAKQKENGWDDGMDAAFEGAEAIRAYAARGGIFTSHQSKEEVWTAGILAAANGVETMEAYGEEGGIFTEQKNSFGVTAREMAGYHGPEGVKAFNSVLAAQQLAKTMWPWRYRERFGPPPLIRPASGLSSSPGLMAKFGL
jgi:hypothetical protein